jgi:hypothetical protein
MLNGIGVLLVQRAKVPYRSGEAVSACSADTDTCSSLRGMVRFGASFQVPRQCISVIHRAGPQIVNRIFAIHHSTFLIRFHFHPLMRPIVLINVAMLCAVPCLAQAQERLMDRSVGNRHIYVDEESRGILDLSPDTDDGLVMLTLLRSLNCPCMLQVTDMDGSAVYLEEVNLGQDETYPIELPQQGHRYILTLRSAAHSASAIVMRQ